MKLFIRNLFIFALLFVWTTSSAAQVQAAFLKFDQASYVVGVDDTFDVEIIVSPGSDEITSIDSYVTYDSSIISAQSVTEGTYFPTVLNDLTTGRAYVAGLVDSPTDFKTGIGTVATITFRAVAEGETDLIFDCDDQATVTSKIIKNDINSTNIIQCDENGTAVITVGVSDGLGGEDNETPTPTKVVTRLPDTGTTETMMMLGLLGGVLVTVGGIAKFMKPY